MPAHPIVVLAVLFLQNIYDTFGHLGHEFFPRWMLRNKWICAVQATPTHHDAHHRYFQGNYSHYFNVWDRLMGTELPQYSHMCQTAYDVARQNTRIVPPAPNQKPRAPHKRQEIHPQHGTHAQRAPKARHGMPAPTGDDTRRPVLTPLGNVAPVPPAAQSAHV
jgi:hypothetical protein